VRRGGVGAEFDDGRRAGDIAVVDPDNINVAERFAGFKAVAVNGSRVRDAAGDDDNRGGYGAVVRADG
jgi:hypothetical protein